MILERVPAWLWFLILLSFVGYESYAATKSPNFKWDFQAYVLASYERADTPLGKRELDLARADIEGFVDQHVAKNGKGRDDSEYGRRFLSEPEVATEILSFYRPRVLFVRAMRVLSKQLPGKLDRARAAHLLGATFTGLGVLVFAGLQRAWGVPWPLVVFASFVTLHGFDVAHVARLGHPDGAAFFVSALLLLAFARGHKRMLLFLCMAAPLLRQDLTVFAMMLLSAGAFARNVRPQFAALCAGASIATHVALSVGAKSPPWTVLMYHSFIERVPRPLSAPKHIDVGQYFEILKRLGRPLVSDAPLMLWFVVLALLGVIATWSYERVRYDRRLLLTLVCTAYAFAHLLLFPMTWNRFFIAVYALTLSALLSVVWEQRSRKRPAEL